MENNKTHREIPKVQLTCSACDWLFPSTFVTVNESTSSCVSKCTHTFLESAILLVSPGRRVLIQTLLSGIWVNRSFLVSWRIGGNYYSLSLRSDQRTLSSVGHRTTVKGTVFWFQNSFAQSYGIMMFNWHNSGRTKLSFLTATFQFANINGCWEEFVVSHRRLKAAIERNHSPPKIITDTFYNCY